VSREVTSRLRAASRLALLALMLCACASPPAVREGSVVSGTIGVAVTAAGPEVVVAAVGPSAARAGVQVGDRVLRYNGAEIHRTRQFERLVLDSVPGTIVRLELSRAGSTHSVELPVEQVRTGNRV
jgi:S1-C subfamily serine protease